MPEVESQNSMVAVVSGPDEQLLREIRDRYNYACDAWREAREHRKVLMRYLCGDPWEPEDRKARKDAGRPCISHDELNQYVNQCVNSARQNKRGIKIEPKGNGATDKTAELRQDLVRTIEYHCNAKNIYLQAYQDEVEGGYGFCRVSRRYVSNDPDGPDDQEIVIRPIPNPDSVLYDPDCKEPDWSDARFCFVVEPMSREEFKSRFPGAEITDFGVEEMRVAPGWITDKLVLVAEYWKVVTERVWNTRKTRKIERKKVVQYLTNGVEILEKSEQPGDEIPIPSFIGMQRWVDDGAGPRRRIFALSSFALEPQMSLAYLCSQEMEEAGQSPKSPYVGYKGQFESDAEAWETATKIPHAFLQADPVVDGADGRVLPLPRRESFVPNFAAFEVAKDSARRAIQASMGISPLPTAAQRNNEKSGIALDKIERQREIGSFHFPDAYERAIQRLGRIVDSWIKATYDTEREVSLKRADDSLYPVRMNTAEPYVPEGGQEPEQHVIGDEQHDVNVSVGPSADSQREAASDFLDLLISNLANLPIEPPARAKLLSLAIRMKQLGPLGDEMADTISPQQSDEMPPQAQQAVSALQQQIEALNAYAKEKEAELAELQRKLDAQVVNNEYRRDIEQMKIEADLAKAEITTKAQNLSERMAFVEDLIKQLNVQRHQADMQAAQHEAAAQQQAQQQAADAAAAQAQAPQEPTQ